jgi:hypothetical protein
MDKLDILVVDHIDFLQPARLEKRLDASRAPLPAIISWKIVRWRATVDKDGHYTLAVALL